MYKRFRNISWLFFVVTMAFIVLGGCATIPVPEHMPAATEPYHHFEDINVAKFSKFEKTLLDGRPQYKVEFPFNNGAYMRAITTAETIGLDQLVDGSKKYELFISATKAHDGRYAPKFITKIISEKANLLMFEEKQKITEQKRKAELAIEKADSEKKWNSGCREVNRSWFCFDNITKLNSHDHMTLGTLLANITYKKLDFRGYRPCGDSNGSWYIEKAVNNEINISLICYSKFVDDIVIDVITRAGKQYYAERTNK